ncbi:hypothetical protein [Paenibacillus sp. FSL R7-0337]|uniref:hypothetical protein n=1 Tax=Paenibacillus sp. FSL R7-0337 TaxID=1926588 RepID=UPI00096C0627|nr:hypothetical protein [Paenibacillus sp. FSL R7-0337]OMF84558.1 hypothetical protein BK147_33115 [Paenibacillus sp. FSL R7-0337]
MQWEEVRKIYPNQYVKLQILASHTEGNIKYVDDVALIRATQGPKEATRDLRKKALHERYTSFWRAFLSSILVQQEDKPN